MPTNGNLPVDLSDLDPYSPTSSPQPPLFTTLPSSASTATPTPSLPAAAINVQATTISPGQGDPLAATLGRIHLGGSSSRPSSANSNKAGTKLVQAQDQRNNRVLTDLAREPFAAEPGPTTTTTTLLSEEPTPLPDLPPPHPHAHAHAHATPSSPRRRYSTTSPGHGHGPGPGFSPPRRLSSLMDLHAPHSVSHALSSPPAETSAIVDPFHPILGRDGEPDAIRRRIREASGGDAAAWPSWGDRHHQNETSGSSDWGDFQAHHVHAPPVSSSSSSSSSSPPASPSRARPIPGSPSSPSSNNHHQPQAPSSSLLGHSFRSATLPLPAPLQSALNSHSFSSFFSLNNNSPTSLDRKQQQSSPPPPHPQPPAPVTRSSAPVTLNGFDPTAQPVRLTGIRPGVVRALDEDIAEGIRPFLPPRLRLSSKWTLLYSLDQHGISIHTLFANLDRGLRDRDGGFVLVVKTERGEVFGAYCNEALRDASAVRGPAQRWAGDGSCFLWKSTPFSPHDFRIGSSVRAFKPTFRNTYYQHASTEFLAFGGGEDGVFGLWIDGVFERGWTGRCETYANEPLVDLRARGVVGGEEDDKERTDAGDGRGSKARRPSSSSSSKAQEEGSFEVVGFECWAVG
ncbi:TLD-domain-containing protein [Rhodotorula sp. JG-1b]|nr:TLD-domain-containing protein [Rhodotorula sp. JG-1b]